ncbi:MAG: ABC transporter ATP-binding protein [Clostridiales bacterium]|nr:ABC transporter ATP-binding protein [Clostridiales bacterium]
MKEPVLTVRNLNSWYEEKQGFAFGKQRFTETKLTKRQVLHEVSFEMAEGEIVGLVGESGCGKSTLAKTILGMVKDKDGAVHIASGRPQMVFQDPYSSLNPAYKIGWILEEPLRLKGGYTKSRRQEKVMEMLARVGLSPEIAERYPRQLSGGQRQRVCIGVALMQQPGLLIADEAVSALDVTIQKQIIDLLLKPHEEMSLAILFISHDLRVVYRICDKVLIMKEGRIIESGTPQEIYFQPKEEYTRTLLEAAGIHIK